MRLYDLVIFDLDGTLIDNRVAIRMNFNDALKEHGYAPISDSAIDAMIGTSLLEMFERATGAPNAVTMVGAYRRGYRTTSHEGVVVLDGVAETLAILRNGGCRLAVATGKGNDEAQQLLKRIKLLENFDLVTGITGTIRAKPHADMLFHIIRSLSVSKNRAVLVGDTPVDILTAKNAGIDVIAVKTGVSLGITTLELLLQEQPTRIIGSLAELPLHVFSGQ